MSCVPGELAVGTSRSTLWDEGAHVEYLRDALTPGESRYLVKRAETSGTCGRSTVKARQGNRLDRNRTSTTCFLPRGDDPVQSCIEHKLATHAGTTVEYMEPLQVTKYRGPMDGKKGELYNPHFDWFTDETDVQRTRTLFVYLQDLGGDECGGATAFTELVRDGEALRVTPKANDGVLWDNLNEDGSGNELTRHAGEEVTCPGREKIGLNVWIRDRPY